MNFNRQARRFGRSARPGVAILAACLLGLRPERARGGMIPADRLPASGWAGQVGIPGGIPEGYIQFCDVRRHIPGTALLAIGDGVADDAPAIQAAVNACPNGQYVFLPRGAYRLNTGIVRKGVNRYDGRQRPFSIEIKGDGPAATRILFYGAAGTIFSFVPGGGQNAQTMAIASGDERGSRRLRVKGLSPYLVPGIYAVVHRLNAQATGGKDPAYMKDTASQIVRVETVDRGSGTITLSPALNEAYPSDYLTVGISPPFRCGIQDLYVKNCSGHGAHNIHIDYGQECWIRNVESDEAAKWHFHLQSAARCEIRECIVHDGWNGGGDSSYGAGLFQYCSNNLIEDNIFYHCRHSMPTEYGGQGNVFGYNYSFDPVNGDLGSGRESQLKTDYLMGDILSHGGEPRWNLYEGNVAATIRFDCVLGGSSDETAFRNLIQRKGLPSTTVACFGSDVQRLNYRANLSGNVYGEPPSETPLRRWGTRQDDASTVDPQSRATAYLDGEVEGPGGSVQWAGGDHILPPSYYLTAKPTWFGSLPWPAVGPDRSPMASATDIPAGRRWKNLVQEDTNP